MIRREKVRLELADNFTPDLARIKDAAAAISADLARQSATWEPHDWGDFA